jgi:hypothetical protein
MKDQEAIFKAPFLPAPKKSLNPDNKLVLPDIEKNSIQKKTPCVNCNKSSVKCDKGRPCSRCIHLEISGSCVDASPISPSQNPDYKLPIQKPLILKTYPEVTKKRSNSLLNLNVYS